MSLGIQLCILLLKIVLLMLWPYCSPKVDPVSKHH